MFTRITNRCFEPVVWNKVQSGKRGRYPYIKPQIQNAHGTRATDNLIAHGKISITGVSSFPPRKAFIGPVKRILKRNSKEKQWQQARGTLEIQQTKFSCIWPHRQTRRGNQTELLPLFPNKISRDTERKTRCRSL